MSKFFGVRFYLFTFKISIQLLFFQFLFSSYCCLVDLCVVCVVSGRCNRFFLTLFLCSLGVVVSMYRRYHLCCQGLFLLLFSTHTTSLCHNRDLRPYHYYFRVLDGFGSRIYQLNLCISVKTPPKRVSWI